MTNRRKKIFIVLLSACIIIAFTACSVKLPFIGTAAVVQPAAQSEPQQQAPAVSGADDEAMKKLMVEYFTKLYSQSPDAYVESSVTGKIPGALKEFLAERTLSEGEGNPENGIHFPRIIELNGLNLVNYEFIKYSDGSVKDGLEISSSFTGRNGDAYAYFVKLGFAAKAMGDEEFKAVYKENPESRTYLPTGVVNYGALKSVNLLLKYNVELIKDEKGFRILSAREANDRPGALWRLSKANNDFAERLPYLLLESTVQGKVHSNPEHQKLYDSETPVIETFFNLLKGIDGSRMLLLDGAWKAGQGQFADMFKKFDLKGYEKMPDKTIQDLMLVDADYKNKFDFYSFPVQTNMRKILEVKNFSILPHPAYSEDRREYIVTFDATVEKQNGIAVQEPYRFDYFVTLGGGPGNAKITGMKLNEAYKVEEKK